MRVSSPFITPAGRVRSLASGRMCERTTSCQLAIMPERAGLITSALHTVSADKDITVVYRAICEYQIDTTLSLSDLADS